MKRGLILLVIFTTVLFQPKAPAQDPNWVKENTWYFDNFVKDVLPWSIFRETYIGVAPAPAGDFDQIFYDQIFKTKLASSGHCYGMDVMAMLMKKNGGYMGYCHPPYMYSGSYASGTTSPPAPSDDILGPNDPNLQTVLEIVHGYQINHSFLMFLLDVLAIGKSRDGRYTFQQVNYYLAKNDPPVISITKSVSPADGGHVLIPFFTKDMGGTKRIYVYDPNRSYYESGLDGKDFYTTAINYIDINSATGAWTYNMGSFGSPVMWSGNPGADGNCIAIPLSIAGKKDRLPQSLLADGSYALNTIFIYGDVKVKQISDLSGQKRMLNDVGTDLEPCDDQRLTTVMPFIPMGVPPSSGETKSQDMYVFKGTDPVKLSFTAVGEYKIGMLFHGHYYEQTGTGKGELLQFQPREENMKK